MISAVIDTNILASAALNESSLARKCLVAAADFHYNLFISYNLLKELERTLSNKYSLKYLTEETIHQYFLELRKAGTYIEPYVTVEGVAGHTADDKILELAVSANADYLVTRDMKFIQTVVEYKGVKLLELPEFWSILLDDLASSVIGSS